MRTVGLYGKAIEVRDELTIIFGLFGYTSAILSI